MNTDFARIEGLLRSSGIEFESVSADIAPHVQLANDVRVYAAMGNRLLICIYEFDGQAALDEAVSVIECDAKTKGKDVVFAQNGGYLMAVMSARGATESDSSLERSIDRLLESFSGEE